MHRADIGMLMKEFLLLPSLSISFSSNFLGIPLSIHVHT